MIARHVGARVWMARCLRIGHGSRFRVELKEIQIERSDNRADDVKAMTTAIFAQFEAWIREAPEQWMWWNTRWEPEAEAA
jgi:KDO2-lipid IV(A) lauroyltransferase